MKKFLLFFAVVATMFAACTKDATKDLPIARPIDKFYVTVGEGDSRVQLNKEGKTVWNAEDKVSIFNKTTDNCCYKFTGQTGDRTGELVYVEGGTTGTAIDKVVALYPYDSVAVLSEGLLQTTIPTTQKYIKDSFGDGGNIMVAVSDNENLSFKHVFGWIKLQLSGNYSVKSITLAGLNNESLAGSITIDPATQSIGNGEAATLTLDCGEGVQLTDTPTAFYIAVIPQTFSNGFYAEVVDADNNIILLKTVKSVTVQRNHIVSMAQSELPLPTGPFHNQIWYTTSDDSIITPKSYQGNIISNTYTDGKGVITFDCAQTEIGEKAFWGCTGLTSITIPDSVTEIGNYAFESCRGLTSVTIPDSVTSIGNAAFEQCTRLTSVTIPDSVTSIGDYAFWGCTGLTSATIPDSVTSIGNAAFQSCTRLTSVTIPDSVTSIGWQAFYDCTSLTSVTIGNSVTSIGNYAFLQCIGLTSVIIPNSVTEIGIGAFSGCTNLASFYGKFASNDNRCLIIDGELRTFAPAGLPAYTIPDSVTSIGHYAFYGCTGLTSVTIGNSVTSIGRSAFYGCTSLTSVTIPDSVTSIGDQAFLDCI